MTVIDDVPHQIRMIDLTSRHNVYVIASKVAAVEALDHDGPTRLIFDAGGSIDVCGSAEIWRRRIAIANLEVRIAANSDAKPEYEGKTP